MPEDKYWLQVVANDYVDWADVMFGNEVVGSIGGEPEDNNHYRSYRWVVPALNEAYQRGIAAATAGEPDA